MAILNHLGFIQSPAPERCSFGHFCVDVQIENLLGERAIRYELVFQGVDKTAKCPPSSVVGCFKVISMWGKSCFYEPGIIFVLNTFEVGKV